MLYIIPTPVGNLEDISLRALRLLQELDLILAEDTRTTKKLFSKYDIHTPLKSYHNHNEHRIQEEILSLLEAGKQIGLVSDAGTPGISDPGFLIVRSCRERGIEVSALPGATAFVPALVSSGLPSDMFHFEGFLPHKKGRQTRLNYLATLEYTFILYESPNRLLRLLKECSSFFGEDRLICVAREISKIHEEIKTDTATALFEYYTAKPPKGELVIIIEGKKKVKEPKGNRYKYSKED